MKTTGILKIVFGAVAVVLIGAVLLLALENHALKTQPDAQTQALTASSALEEAYESNTEKPESAAEPSAEKTVSEDKTPKASADAQVVVDAGAQTSGSVAVDGISELKIEWVSGIVNVSVGTGTEIAFFETADVPLSNGQKLIATRNGDKLKISYCDATDAVWKWLDLDKIHMPRKDLTVTVPADVLKKMKIEAVSATVTVDGVGARETDIETVSGEINAKNVSSNEFDAESVSGKITLNGVAVTKLDVKTTSGSLNGVADAREVDLETVSGDMELNLLSTPFELDTEAISGSITLGLPENAGFRLSFESVSGDYESEFASVKKGKTYIVGDGTGVFETETVSGDVRFVIYKG